MIERRLKRRKNESVGLWLVRLVKNLNLTKEQTEILFEVRKEAERDGFDMGMEVQRIKQKQQ